MVAGRGKKKPLITKVCVGGSQEQARIETERGGQIRRRRNHRSGNSLSDERISDCAQIQPSQGIWYLGPDFSRSLSTLVIYYWTALCFSAGARSLHEVAAMLEELQMQGIYPERLPCGASTLSRYCREAEAYFGKHFRLGGRPAELFVRGEKGFSISDMTETGVDLYAWVREFLVKFQVIEEEEPF